MPKYYKEARGYIMVHVFTGADNGIDFLHARLLSKNYS